MTTTFMVWKTGKTMMPGSWKKEYKMSMNILGDKMMSLVKGIIGYFALHIPIEMVGAANLCTQAMKSTWMS